MNISLLLFIGFVLFSMFQLGRCSMDAETERLQEENRQLRDLLDKACSLDELGAQTYSKIACELAAAYAQVQREAQSRK